MDNMFTPSAKHVLALAHEQAKYFKHQAVGTNTYYLRWQLKGRELLARFLSNSPLLAMIFKKKLSG